MEKLSTILEKTLDEYKEKLVENNLNDTFVECGVEDIIKSGEELESRKDIAQELIDIEIRLKFELIRYISSLLNSYGKFKRVPSYYKIVGGQPKDYVFIKLNNSEINGFKIMEKNKYIGNGFITEELYFLKEMGFYKFSSYIEKSELYKECYRDLVSIVDDPTLEWGFWDFLNNINILLRKRLESMSSILEKEVVIIEYLEKWNNDILQILKL